MRCTCEKWIEKIAPGQQIHVRSQLISHCPFCGNELIADKFKIYLTYDGPDDKDKIAAIRATLPFLDIGIMPDTNVLFTELSLL